MLILHKWLMLLPNIQNIESYRKVFENNLLEICCITEYARLQSMMASNMQACAHRHTYYGLHMQHLYMGESICTQWACQSAYIPSSFSMNICKGRDGPLGRDRQWSISPRSGWSISPQTLISKFRLLPPLCTQPNRGSCFFFKLQLLSG